jgi:hypothetical protein
VQKQRDWSEIKASICHELESGSNSPTLANLDARAAIEILAEVLLAETGDSIFKIPPHAIKKLGIQLVTLTPVFLLLGASAYKLTENLWVIIPALVAILAIIVLLPLTRSIRRCHTKRWDAVSEALQKMLLGSVPLETIFSLCALLGTLERVLEEAKLETALIHALTPALPYLSPASQLSEGSRAYFARAIRVRFEEPQSKKSVAEPDFVIAALLILATCSDSRASFAASGLVECDANERVQEAARDYLKACCKSESLL